jgi:mono/diheme cytochrome c family protein
MKALRPVCLLVGLGIASAAPRVALVQTALFEAKDRRNPFAGNDQARRAGAKLYGRECAPCHGQNREGLKGPPLLRPQVYGSPPGSLFWILRNGHLRRGMPSFAQLPEAQRWQIITFLKSKTNR